MSASQRAVRSWSARGLCSQHATTFAEPPYPAAARSARPAVSAAIHTSVLTSAGSASTIALLSASAPEPLLYSVAVTRRLSNAASDGATQCTATSTLRNSEVTHQRAEFVTALACCWAHIVSQTKVAEHMPEPMLTIA